MPTSEFRKDECIKVFQEVQAVKEKLDYTVKYCDYYYENKSDIINIWKDLYYEGNSERKLVLLYVVHELLCKELQMTTKGYTELFSSILPDCIKTAFIDSSENIQKRIIKLIVKWNNFNFFDTQTLFIIISQIPMNILEQSIELKSFYDTHYTEYNTLINDNNKTQIINIEDTNANTNANTNEDIFVPIVLNQIDIQHTKPKDLPCPDSIHILQDNYDTLKPYQSDDIFIKETINKANRVMDYINSLHLDTDGIQEDQNTIEKEIEKNKEEKQNNDKKVTVTYEDISKQEMISLLDKEITKLTSKEMFLQSFLSSIESLLHTTNDEIYTLSEEENQRKKECNELLSIMKDMKCEPFDISENNENNSDNDSEIHSTDNLFDDIDTTSHSEDGNPYF